MCHVPAKSLQQHQMEFRTLPCCEVFWSRPHGWQTGCYFEHKCIIGHMPLVFMGRKRNMLKMDWDQIRRLLSRWMAHGKLDDSPVSHRKSPERQDGAALQANPPAPTLIPWLNTVILADADSPSSSTQSPKLPPNQSAGRRQRCGLTVFGV